MAVIGRPSLADTTPRAGDSHARGLIRAAATIVVGSLLVAACGGGSTKTAAPPTTTTSTTAGVQSHGVDVSGLRGVRGGSTPSSLPAGVTSQQFDQAMQACRSLLPTGGNFQNNPAFAAYRNCLQLHGVTLPAAGSRPGGPGTTVPGAAAPSTVPPGGAGQGFGGLDRNNPTVAAALTACAALRPAAGSGGQADTTTTVPASS
jgi:hypothetical protein